MFKKAVNAHSLHSASDENKGAKPLHFTSSTSATTLDGPVNQTSFQKGVLQPSSSSTLNHSQPVISRPFNPPTKRTSSGLAKAIGNVDGGSAFEEATQPRDNSTTARGAPPRTMSKQTSVIIDEDDFDSDVDLDVEDLVNKATVTYPKLPASQTGQSTVSYPKIQQSHLHTSASNAAQQPAASNHEHSPQSSVPVPWSSSPIEHKQGPPKHNLYSKYALDPQYNTQSRDEPPRSADPTLARPSKRRTLPWLSAQSQEPSEAPHSAVYPTPASTRPRSKDSSTTTPASKRGPAVSYPWNTTASAMKEQQKQLRKAGKKVLMSNEVVDDPKESAATHKKAKSVGRPCLSAEQRHVLDLVVESGKSVFFTGSAGTGKSVLLREIIAVLRKKHAKESDRVAITASTGLAACNIGGVTLHSFSGIGLGKEDVPELVKKIKRNQKAKHRWMRTKVLIVDEISMVDGELFDKLEEIARRVRGNGRPFGGIQLVITGDFFQLPPVPDANRIAKFAFDAASWPATIDHTIGLHHVFRQKDATFANMLNEMREGRLSPNTIKTFQKLSRPIETDDHLQATELFPTRNEVDAANSKRMSMLQGDEVPFHARDGGTIIDTTQRQRLLQNCMAPELLMLKKGSQVMLIKNIDETLVNGSLGRVKAFMNEQTFEYYTKDPDEFENAQEAADEDLNPTQLKQKRMMNVMTNTSQVWPLVEFQLTDGTTRDMLCNRETWKIELPNGEVQASRQQVPLILAWALSIHKAQGQTLERVKVDLGKIFERGQAYVALSRATSMGGLQVLRFDPSKVQAHDKVKGFYAGLSRAHQADGAGMNDFGNDEMPAGYY